MNHTPEKPLVLIADDDAGLRRTLSDILKVKGYEPLPAPDGKTAIELAKKHSPAVALIDLKLGDMSGTELLREIKQLSPTTECIVLTGYASQPSAIEAVQWGAYSYLVKPYDPDQLLLTIQRSVEKRSAELALRASERKYRLLAENVSDVIFTMDLNMRFTYISPSIERQSGYTVEEAMAHRLENILTPESYELARKVYEEELAAEKCGEGPAFRTRTLELQARHKNGSTIWIEVKFNFLRDEAGKPIGILGVSRDITDRKRAEEVVKAERDKLQALVDGLAGAGVGIDIVGSDYVVLFQNRVLRERFGNLVGKLCYEGYMGLKQPCGNCPMKAAVSKGGVRGAEAKARDGRYYQLLCAPLPNPDGTVDRAIEIVLDVTERKAAEEERQRLQAQLLQAQKMEAIGRLVGGVAHDFNNLLTPIKGFSELSLRSVSKDDWLYENLKQIHDAAERAGKVVRQLLLFSRRQPMEFVPLDLNKTVEGLMKMLERLIGEDITINTDLAQDLRPILGDASNIEQVIMNLAVNARDAMPDGGTLTIKTENVTLTKEECRRMPESRPGKFVRLTVADTGMGMDGYTLRYIFEPFFTTKKEGVGTGLGLSVVYGIVKSHNGWINVHSELGKGSTFEVYFPVAGTSNPPTKEEEIPLDKYRGKGEHILIVEDDESVRDFISRMLTESGYKVTSAGSLDEALRVFDRLDGKFALIFSDVVLPDGTGLELAEQLLSRKPDLGILLSSGYTNERAHIDEIRRKGVEFLQKPYSAVDLLRALRKLLDKR